MIFLRRHSILQNTVLLTLANLSLRAVSLLFQSWLAGTIGAEGLGKMQLVLTVGGFAFTLGTSGIRVAAMNLTARLRGLEDAPGMKKAIRACLLYGLLLSIAAGALLLAAAPLLARTVIGDTAVIPALSLLGLSLPVNCLTAVFSGCYTARGKVRTLVAVDVLERFVSIGITAVLLRFWADGDTARILCSVIGGSSLAALLSLVLLAAFQFPALYSIPDTQESMTGPLLRLCVPLALSDYLRSGLSTLEQFLIPRGLRLSGSRTAMADYGTICGMVFPVLMFPAALFYSLADLLVPELSRCRAQGKQVRIRCLTARCLRIGLVFSSMVAGLQFALAPALGQLIYHSAAAGRYLRIFAPMIFMLYSDALTDGMLKGLGEQVASVRYNTVTAAADVVLLFLLLPRLGVSGFIFTFAVTHAVNFYLSIRRLRKVTGFRPDLPHAARTAIAAALAAGLTLKLTPPLPRLFSVLATGGVFLGIYFLLSYFLKVFHPRELLPFTRAKSAPPQAERQTEHYTSTTSQTVITPSLTRKRTSNPANRKP